MYPYTSLEHTWNIFDLVCTTPFKPFIAFKHLFNIYAFYVVVSFFIY